MTSGKDSKVALLATRSDTLAAGMSALLLSIPPIGRVDVREDVGTLVAHLDGQNPALIMIDSVLIDVGSSEQIDALRQHAPHSLLVYLTEDMSEFRRLESATADTVVMKGTDPAQLAQRLEQLLREHVAP